MALFKVVQCHSRVGQKLESRPHLAGQELETPPGGSGAREPALPGWSGVGETPPPGGSGAREPALPGWSEGREHPSPGLKLVNNQDTRRPKSSHSHLYVVIAVSSLDPYGCGETNRNGQAEVASTLTGVVKLTGIGRQI